MSLVTVKDFGVALNISGGTIRSKISRGQLVRNKFKLIDTDDPVNFLYILEVNGGDQSVFEKYHQNVYVGTKIIKKVSPARKTTKTAKKITTNSVVQVKTVSSAKKLKIEEVSNDEGSVRGDPSVEPKKTVPKKVVVEEEIPISKEEKKRISEEKKARETFLQIEIRKKLADVELVERNSEIKKMQLEKIAGNTLPLDITTNVLRINLQSIFKTFSSELENMATITVETLGGTRSDLVKITNAQNVMLKKIVELAKENANQEIERYIMEYSETRSRGERK
jgi:hypothetical protein